MTAFPPNSRYYMTPERTRTLPDGTVQTFTGRRIIPATERFVAMDRLRLTGAERIDMIANLAYGDPELYWRICDANGDQDPARATDTPGRLLILPLPLEVASDGNA